MYGCRDNSDNSGELKIVRLRVKRFPFAHVNAVRESLCLVENLPSSLSMTWREFRAVSMSL